ncbi:MAG: hypothetical protein LBS90_00860 [Oscillospiraceae bacterium]|nr:hypothetical protein [Oscillospiraceae bacterium]
MQERPQQQFAAANTSVNGGGIYTSFARSGIYTGYVVAQGALALFSVILFFRFITDFSIIGDLLDLAGATKVKFIAVILLIAITAVPVLAAIGLFLFRNSPSNGAGLGLVKGALSLYGSIIALATLAAVITLFILMLISDSASSYFGYSYRNSAIVGVYVGGMFGVLISAVILALNIRKQTNILDDVRKVQTQGAHPSPVSLFPIVMAFIAAFGNITSLGSLGEFAGATMVLFSISAIAANALQAIALIKLRGIAQNAVAPQNVWGVGGGNNGGW